VEPRSLLAKGQMALGYNFSVITDASRDQARGKDRSCRAGTRVHAAADRIPSLDRERSTGLRLAGCSHRSWDRRGRDRSGMDRESVVDRRRYGGSLCGWHSQTAMTAMPMAICWRLGHRYSATSSGGRDAGRISSACLSVAHRSTCGSPRHGCEVALPHLGRRGAALEGALQAAHRAVLGGSLRRVLRPETPANARVSAQPSEADDGARTRDPWLGKPMLYQLSYVRRLRGF
jgi:hypothetical protein